MFLKWGTYPEEGNMMTRKRLLIMILSIFALGIFLGSCGESEEDCLNGCNQWWQMCTQNCDNAHIAPSPQWQHCQDTCQNETVACQNQCYWDYDYMYWW